MTRQNPYQAPTVAQFETSEMDFDRQYAGFWIRLVAVIIDTQDRHELIF